MYCYSKQEPTDTREGDWFLTFYTVTKWPHVSILDPRTGGRLLSLSDITKENIFDTCKNMRIACFEKLQYAFVYLFKVNHNLRFALFFCS